MDFFRKSLTALVATTLMTGATLATAADSTIRIGFIAPMSGTFGDYGKKLYNALLAYQKVNGDTIEGKKIEIIVRDNSNSSPATAKRLAQELLTRDKVDILTGFALSSDALAVAPLATEAKTPMVVLESGATNLTDKSPYMVRTCYTGYQMAAPMGEWAPKNGVKKAFILVSDYQSGYDSEDAFKKSFTEHGGTVVGSVHVPLNNIDFSPYVQRIKDSGADAVYVFIPGGQLLTAFMKSYTERGLAQSGIRVLLSMTDMVPEYLNPMGDGALNLTTSMMYFYTLNNPQNAMFQKAYQSIAHEKGGAIVVTAYDGMALIYAAIHKLKGNVSDGAKVVDAMRGMTIDSPRGQFTIDAKTRDIVQTVYIAKIVKQNNEYVPTIIDSFANVKP
ncbi:MAG: ABC transporter substrate-binding protein [Janthinobacterium lividum]